MLQGVWRTFHWTNRRKGFDAYYADLPALESSGAPTALRGLRRMFLRTSRPTEFDAYYADLLTLENSGVPTADEARRDYESFLSSRTYIA